MAENKNHSPTVLRCESHAAYLRLCCGALLTVAQLDDYKAVKQTVDEIVRMGAVLDETLKNHRAEIDRFEQLIEDLGTEILCLEEAE